MQISDSSSRILAGLLEARTGQQLTMSRRWRIETALSALLRERGIATLDELITILVMGKEPSLSQQVVEALLNNETYFFRDRAPFDLLAAPCAARACEAPRQVQAAAHLVGGLLDRPGSLFAGDAVRRGARAMARLDRSTSSAPTSRPRASIARAAASTRQFEIQRGLGIDQMIKWFEEVADGWRAVETLRKPVRFQVHNMLEPRAASRATSTSCCAATCCST